MRGLLHLDHEGRLPARDVVGGADARVNAIDDTDLRFARGDERSGLGQQAQQGHLPQVGRLAAHVRASENHELVRRAVQPHVIRHERAARQPFDHGMAEVDGDEFVTVIHKRLRVVAERRGLGESGQHIERRHGLRGIEQSCRFCRHALPKGLEELELTFDEYVRPHRARFVFVVLEGRGHEALAAGNRLLAVIVIRHRMQVRFRDLDVVAKHAIEAHLERLDSGARPLLFLELGDDLLARPRNVPELVDLFVHAVADESAVSRQRRRLVVDRLFDPLADVGQVVQLAGQADRRAAPDTRRAARAMRGTAANEMRNATRSRGLAVDERDARRSVARGRGPS